jgi:hypothetical protein
MELLVCTAHPPHNACIRGIFPLLTPPPPLPTTADDAQSHPFIRTSESVAFDLAGWIRERIPPENVDPTAPTSARGHGPGQLDGLRGQLSTTSLSGSASGSPGAPPDATEPPADPAAAPGETRGRAGTHGPVRVSPYGHLPYICMSVWACCRELWQWEAAPVQRGPWPCPRKEALGRAASVVVSAPVQSVQEGRPCVLIAAHVVGPPCRPVYTYAYRTMHALTYAPLPTEQADQGIKSKRERKKERLQRAGLTVHRAP